MRRRSSECWIDCWLVVGVGWSSVAPGHAANSGFLAGGRGETDFLEFDPVVGVGWNAEAADQAGSSSVCRMQSDRRLNSRIRGSQSSSFACARVSSGCLLGAHGVGSASAAVGSACLPAVRTRSYADVAASACGGMAVKQGHARNSVVCGGFLPVHKSTSYNLGTGRQGPTWRRGSKGGVSSPAEDLRPVSEVEAGVNFRLAGGIRRQVAGSLPRKQPGTGTRQHRVGVDTFPPPGGSWYPIRVTWTWIGHQAINGLDEGVWNHTVGDLGAKG